MKKDIALLMALLALPAFVFAGGSKDAKPGNEKKAMVFKYSVTYPGVGTQAEGAARMGQLIKEYTQGRIEMKFYPSSQLGDKMPSLEGLRNGTIEMSECAASDLSNFNKIWSVFSLPYMFNNGEGRGKSIEFA